MREQSKARVGRARVAMERSLKVSVIILIFGIFESCNCLAAIDNGRIVGGADTTINNAPFAVSIQQLSNGKSVHYCGGSIISANWVLTAAHCLSSKSLIASSVLVAGSTNVAVSDSTVQKRTLDQYIVHNLYVGGTAPYDIGLIYTNTAFQMTTFVNSISLPTTNTIPTGSAALYGWGSTSTTTTPNYPSKLQTAQLEIISNQNCETALGSMGSRLHTTNVCSASANGGKGICTSDSGGPLVQKSTIIGIVSWGPMPCGQPNIPSVYVRVSSFIPWITENMKKIK